jgi:16S rRNA (adenine1518-N6/adenine1519-N6)-dimethyltransferase
MRFIEDAKNVKAMVIMVQEEVAYRFSAKNSSSDYGAITVGINLRGNAEILIKVPREKFTPAPNVDSAVVKISIDRDKFKDADKNAVRNLVRCAFSSRRKMLVNNLMNGYKFDRSTAEKVLIDCDIELTKRGEGLSAEDFVKLSNAIEKIKKER